MKKLIHISLLIISLFFAHTTIVNARNILSNKPIPPKERSLVRITLIKPDATDQDTMVLYYFKDILITGSQEGYAEIKATANATHQFVFEFHITSPTAYIEIGKSKVHGQLTNYSALEQIYLLEYLVQGGDYLTILMNPIPKDQLSSAFGKYRFKFYGTGAEKYNLRFRSDSIAYFAKGGDIITAAGRYNSDNVFKARIKAGVEFLDKSKMLVDSYVYELLKTDLIYSLKKNEIDVLQGILSRFAKVGDSSRVNEVFRAYRDTEAKDSYVITERAKMISKSYAEFQLKFRYREYNSTHQTFNIDSIYYVLKKKYHGPIFDRIVSVYFASAGIDIQDYDHIIEDASHIVYTPSYSIFLKELKNRMTGVTAYDFALPDTSGKIIHLHDFKGKLVMVDFWFTGCAHCSDYYKAVIKNVEEQFKGNPNIVFVTISIDRGESYWKKTVRASTYTSPDAVNLYTEGKGGVHPVLEHYKVHSYPQPMLIGKDQKILLFSSNALMDTNSLINVIQSHLN